MQALRAPPASRPAAHTHQSGRPLLLQQRSGTWRLHESARRAVAAQSQAKPDPVVVVGDIGGTNARLACWSVSDAGSSECVHAVTYSTQEFPTFEECMKAFLDTEPVREKHPHVAALAVAGAVVENRCVMTNTSWVVDGNELQSCTGVRTAVLNDFEAVGYGIPVLSPADVVAINDVPVLPKAPKVVMGPGTGLGAAQLMWDTGTKSYHVWPGEGAHATFAPRGWKQKALASYVTHLYGHCEIEQVACGSGLVLIYRFLATDERANRPELLVHKDLDSLQPSDISIAALAGDPLAVEAVDLFYAIVGAEAGAMALRCLAKGGVYIAGGVTPKLLPRVKAGALLEGFLMRNGRPPFRAILASTPLFVITNEHVGQMGAVEYAKSLL